jgi:beta-galactosidase
MGAGSFMEIYFKKHPVFKGIKDEMAWEAPMDMNRELFENCLDLNDSFLALAPVAHYQNPDSVKAIISNRRCGKGEMFLSMVKATDRFGKDATLTRYVENLMAYILGDTISEDAVTTGMLVAADSTNAMFMDKRDAFFVDLSKAANRSFIDDVNGIGWAGFGPGSDLHQIQPGRNTIAGSVPFEILDPSENHGKSCIVLSGPRREQFPVSSGQIKIGRRCTRLFFLHTAMWVNAEHGESLLEYRITYADGKVLTVPMNHQSQIGDWWQAKDYEAARVAYREQDRCIFATQWVNPRPDVPIICVQAVSTGKAIPIILAMTAESPDAGSTQQIDRTELQDNRQ